MKLPGVLLAACILVVTAGGLALRLPRLDRRPMHCDEANQAVKAGRLLETGVYRYDAHEHHGPSLYWLTLPSLWLSSAEDFARSGEIQYRIVPAVFGAALVLLLLLVADGLGRGPAVLAGILAAISPAMVFYSRYYIQETLLMFFTLAAIGCGWRYVRRRLLGWAIAAGAFVGLMHATKETWVLSAAAAVFALALAAAWTRWRDGRASNLMTYLRPGPMLAAVVAAGLVAVALYSSFGAHPRGPADSILAYATYLRRGAQGGIHEHPWHYYLQLLLYNRPARGFFWTEGLIVGLAAIGLINCLCLRQRAVDSGEVAPGREKGDSPHLPERPEGCFTQMGTVPFFPRAASPAFCRFLAFYTLALTILYAVIPYKTPWCMLSFLHGMTLLAGVGAWAILRAVPTAPLKALAAVLLIVAAVHLGRQCYALNFRFYAHRRNPYVYAHTSSDLLNLAEQMERLARVSPEGHEMLIHVVTPQNYWPLPWYLRHFNLDRVGYWQDAATWQSDTGGDPPPSVIILTGDVRDTVDANLRADYNKLMTYGLRPTVLLSVYVREDLWQAFVSAVAASP